ncbi:hypothetical protein [Rhizobium leguminosarum]|uniref:hypothetical protein n=1 Tax=Rhizobium leguminosarum TaxID=384 RepID=UPI003D033A66
MADEINWRRIRTYHDLELPPHRDLGLPTQKWTLRIPENYILLNPRRTKYGVFTFRGWQQPAKDSEPLAQLVHNDTSDMILLSNQQITELVKQGRIRPVMGPDDGPRNRPGSSFAVVGEARERAEKRLAYADGMEEEMRNLRVKSLTDEQKERVVKEVAERIGDKDPPKRTSWYEILKISRKGSQFDRLLDFVDHHENKGNRTLRYGRAVAAAIRAAAEEAVSLNGDWKSVRAILIRTIRPNGINYHLREQIVDEDGNFKIEDRKMQRTLGQLNHYVRDFLLEGPDYAERIHQRYLSQVRPDAPLAVVDVDHSTLDIVVFDSEYPIAYGRPDIVLFRDRFSGIVIGFAISFGAPSYQTFLEGLKHMIFEKDPLAAGVPWPWHGVPVELGADNAKHLQGINIKGAARELGFRLKAYRPGRPWEKGAEEHLFAILGRKIHRLPGSTESTHERRDDFDEEKERAKPILSIQELYGFLNFYFGTIHHYKPTSGLGPLATLKGVPAERWEDEIANAPDAPIMDRDVLIRLAGDINEVTISEVGARLDYIVYNCAELLVLTTNPEHYAGRKYQARRDPSDLEMIRIKNPYVQAEHWIDVPAREADIGYARGMKLWAHKIIMKHLRDQAKEADRKLTLVEAQVELEAKLAEVHANRKKYNTAQLMARFYNSNLRKEERSRVTEMGRVEYSEGRLNLAAMPEIEPPERVNVRSVAVMPTVRETPVTEQKATVTRTIAGEHIPKATFDKFDDGLPDDLADWDL